MDASLDHADGPPDLHLAEDAPSPSRRSRVGWVAGWLWRWVWPRGDRQLGEFPVAHRATLRNRAMPSRMRWAFRRLVSGAVGLITSAPFAVAAVQSVELASRAASWELWFAPVLVFIGLAAIGAGLFLAVSRRCELWFLDRQIRRLILHAGRCYGCGYWLLARPGHASDEGRAGDGPHSCPECGQVNELDADLAESVLSNPCAAERLVLRGAREARATRAAAMLAGLACGVVTLVALGLGVAWHVVCVNHRELQRLHPSPAAYAELWSKGERPDERFLPVTDAAQSVFTRVEELAEAPLAAFFSGPRARSEKEVAEFGPFNLHWRIRNEGDERFSGSTDLKSEELSELVTTICAALRDGGALEHLASVADARRPLTSVTGELSPHWESLPWRVTSLIDLTALLSWHAVRTKDEQLLLASLAARQGLLRLRSGLAVPNHPAIRRQREDLLTDVLFAATVATKLETLDALGGILDRAHQPDDARILAGALYLDILNMNTAYLQPVPFGGAWDRWLTEAWQERRLTGEQLDAALLRRIAEDWKRQADHWLALPASERRPIRSLSTGTTFDGFLRVFDERMMQAERPPDAITLARVCIAYRRFELRAGHLPEKWTECPASEQERVGSLGVGKIVLIEAVDAASDPFGRSFRADVVQQKLGFPSSNGGEMESRVLFLRKAADTLNNDANRPSLVGGPSR